MPTSLLPSYNTHANFTPSLLQHSCQLHSFPLTTLMPTSLLPSYNTHLLPSYNTHANFTPSLLQHSCQLHSFPLTTLMATSLLPSYNTHANFTPSLLQHSCQLHSFPLTTLMQTSFTLHLSKLLALNNISTVLNLQLLSYNHEYAAASMYVCVYYIIHACE